MLEGEGNNVLDALNRVGRGVFGKTLANDDFDTTNVVAGAPVVLIEQLAAERRELERLKLALLRHLCHVEMVSLVEEHVFVGRGKKCIPQVVVIKCGHWPKGSKEVELYMQIDQPPHRQELKKR